MRVVSDLEQIYDVTAQNYTHIAAVGISQTAVAARRPDFHPSEPFSNSSPLSSIDWGSANRPILAIWWASTLLFLPKAPRQITYKF